MQTVSLLVRSAVSAAVAQVLPLARTQTPSASHDAKGLASPPSSSTHGGLNYNNNTTGKTSDPMEDGEVRDEQLDEYERRWKFSWTRDLTGPEISDKIGRLLEHCLGAQLDEKVVRRKLVER